MSCGRSRRLGSKISKTFSPRQVFAKLTAGNSCRQVSIARGNDTHVRLEHTRATEPLKLPFLQDAQELRLRSQAHLGHFVEEQHARAREFELAGLGRHRAGKRAAFVAEELRLEKLFR